MKQGKATHSGMGSTKVEPKTQVANQEFIERMGAKVGNHSSEGPVRVTKVPLYEGRGLEAPMKGTSTHKAGRQGRH